MNTLKTGPNPQSAQPTPTAEQLLEDGPILLYDGECGVCAVSVQWILNHERAHSLRFASQQSQIGMTLREHTAIEPQIDSLIWMERESAGDQKVRARIWSDAVLSVLDYVGGPWKFLTMMRWVPAPLRHAAYRLFARNRLRFVPKSCMLPAPQVRRRFLAT